MQKKLISLKCVLLVITIAASNNSFEQSYFNTVTGKIVVDSMKGALIHEHVVTNFIGADSVLVPNNISAASFKTITEHFNKLHQSNINFVFECTPSYIGKDVKLLKKISEATGIKIVTNTGFYAAVNKKYIPSFVYKESIDAIAARWENDFNNGIDGTGIKPGFIKLGVGNNQLDSIETKLLKAAIAVSKKTGLTIAVHTGSYEAAQSEYDILMNENYNPSKLVWVHAQNANNEQRKLLAEKGVWISMDGLSKKSIDEYVAAIVFMKQHHLLNRLLISHDDGWAVIKNGSYDELELFGNGNTEPYNSISTLLIPKLKEKGFTQDEIDLLLVKNPVACFALK